MSSIWLALMHVDPQAPSKSTLCMTITQESLSHAHIINEFVIKYERINIPYLNDSTYYLPSHYHGAPHVQPDAGQSGS